MKLLIRWLIDWPEGVARHLTWLAPLFARITVGWVFLLSGWGKINNLPQVTENFIGWGIPFPHFFTPLTSGIEFFGGSALAKRVRTRRLAAHDGGNFVTRRRKLVARFGIWPRWTHPAVVPRDRRPTLPRATSGLENNPAVFERPRRIARPRRRTFSDACTLHPVTSWWE